MTWVFMGLSGFAFLQSMSVFSWQSQATVPASISLQRWALGLSPAPSNLGSKPLMDVQPAESYVEPPCDLADIPPENRMLSWSVEPLHTRAAFFSLVMCGLMVWIGRMVFSEPKKQLWLFGALTLAGVMIACIGIQGAVSYKAENFLGLKSGGSFATFVSKNSAGGYFNICIAGCLGLLGWTLLNTQRKSNDVRYRFPDSSWIMKVKGLFEDLLADLNTPQIASMMCLVTVVAAMMISLCRGAAVSALAALIAATLIANSKNNNRGSWPTTVAIVLASVACMVGFQIDEEAYSRLESLSEIDVEEEFRSGRAYIWSIAWRAASYYGLFGSGLGTFHFAYLPFQDPSSSNWYYHAESLYFQCVVELGYIGLALMVVSILAVMAKIQRRVPVENWKIAFPAKLAGGYLVFSQALHSFVDFAIIIPALFVPASLLLGSVQGLLDSASILPPAKRGSGKSSESTVVVTPKPTAWLRHGIVGIAICVVGGISLYTSIGCIKSHMRAESMAAWVKQDNLKSISDQTVNRVSEVSSVWSSWGSPIANEVSAKEDSSVQRILADAMVFDYRMDQLVRRPPQGSWADPWKYTSPLFLQLALAAEKDPKTREAIVSSVGGKGALELLNRASQLYGSGQAKSPLDWRLALGRCMSNLNCPHKEMTRLVAVCSYLAKHSSNNLLTLSILFRDSLGQDEIRKLRSQSIASNIGAAYNVARLIAEEASDGEVDVDLFPQRTDIMQGLANQVFTKERFPKSHVMFWHRAKKLSEAVRMLPFEREVWLATYSEAIGDEAAKIDHLRKAVKSESRNIGLICRLGFSLLETGDLEGAKVLLGQGRSVDPTNAEIKKLAARIQELE